MEAKAPEDPQREEFRGQVEAEELGLAEKTGIESGQGAIHPGGVSVWRCAEAEHRERE